MTYLSQAPVALAFERTIECRLYPQLAFERPVLDIGCGEGLFAKILFKEKIDTGIDPNARELERARELGAYEELIECWGNKIPKPDGTFRTVFSNSVLEHIPDLKPVLLEIHRLMAAGGNFYFTVPSNYFDHYTIGNQSLSGIGLKSLATRFRRFFNSFWRHYHFYSLEEWRKLATDAGFEVVESFTYNPQRVCLFNDFSAPFSILSLFLKKFSNKWVLFPSVRRVIFIPIYLLGKRLLANGERVEKGGLVFMHLRKV